MISERHLLSTHLVQEILQWIKQNKRSKTQSVLLVFWVEKSHLCRAEFCLGNGQWQVWLQDWEMEFPGFSIGYQIFLMQVRLYGDQMSNSSMKQSSHSSFITLQWDSFTMYRSMVCMGFTVWNAMTHALVWYLARNLGPGDSVYRVIWIWLSQ